MRSNIDRAPGVRLVTDSALDRVASEIAALPEVDEGPFTAPPDIDVVVLESRCYAGLLVELRYSRATQRVVIAVREGEEGAWKAAIVPPEKALDAFDHPYCYLQ